MPVAARAGRAGYGATRTTSGASQHIHGSHRIAPPGVGPAAQRAAAQRQLVPGRRRCSSATGGPAGCTCSGLAFLVAGRSSFWLIAAMSVLILAVGWAYTQICRIYPDGGGVYTAGRRRSAHARRHRRAAAVRRLHDHRQPLSAVEAFHYFGLGKHDAARRAGAAGPRRRDHPARSSTSTGDRRSESAAGT